MFKCHFAKGLWFTTPWGIRWEGLHYKDLNAYLDKIWNSAGWFSATKYDIFDHIWWVRNKIMFKDTKPILDESILTVRQKFVEFKHAFASLFQNTDMIPRDLVLRNLA